MTETINNVQKEKVALLGFGDIAQRVVPHLQAYDVTGVKRSSVVSPVNIVLADCRDKQQMNTLLSQGFDVLIMSFVPTEFTDEGYKQGYVDTVSTILAALKMQTHQPRLLVFVSSSSVYGQTDGSWVNEQSPTLPNSFSGQRLLEAEQLLAKSGIDYCCVRFSGIYGPGRRRLIDQVIAGQGSPSDPPLYSNRIHADDGAAFIAHIIEKHKTEKIEPCYLATDCEPAPLHEVKEWIAEQLGFEHNHLQHDGARPARMQRSSKRCSNQQMQNSGFMFRYPTFREGYQMLIDSLE